MENRSPDQNPEQPTTKTVERPSATSRALEAAAKVGIGKSQSLFTLVLVSVAASILIASYVLALGLFIMHKKHTDTVGDAALEAARQLADITVEHPSTGPLNLCLWRDNGSLFFSSSGDKSRSFESVRRTYLKIEQLATITNLPVLRALVAKDENTLTQIEKELRFKLERAILAPMPPATTGGAQSTTTPTITATASSSPGIFTGGDDRLPPGKIYRAVASMIAARYGLGQSSVLDLSIKLGYASTPPIKSKAQMFLVGAENFRPASPGTAPNMVLLTYTEPVSRERQQNQTIKPLIACVYIKPAPESPSPAAFVLTFPQGAPSIAMRLIDYLHFNWQSKGLWHQAMGGEIPGAGRLAPPLEPLLPEMTPGDALAAEIYHWLKYAGDQIDPPVVAQMLNETWTQPAVHQDANHVDEHSFGMMDEQINSGIVRDTGSREHSLMYESKEGEVGQSAISRAFQINDSRRSWTTKSYIPENAFPLFIDQSGRCNIAGQSVFDDKLIRDFFSDLYATNLAARETLATLKPLQQMSVQLIAQMEQKLRIEREELASLVLRVNRLNSASDASSGKDKKLAMQLRITSDRIEDLKLLVESDTNQLRETKNLQRLATVARYNASRAELNTFDLNAQKVRYCRDGLCRIPGQGYMLGKNVAFRPIPKALLEADFYQISSSDDSKAISPWLSNNLLVTGSPADVFSDLDKKLTSRWQSQIARDSVASRFTPVMLAVDSRSILEGRKWRPGKKFFQAYTKYPFNNILLPESELLYYCQTAVTTGSQPKVGWSILARDFLANRGLVSTNQSSPTFVGLPAPAGNSSWCHTDGFGTSSCPGLACEFQIRAPLPLFEKPFEDAYLQNAENGQRAPLIPVVTPDML